jgi:hypothetical protein
MDVPCSYERCCRIEVSTAARHERGDSAEQSWWGGDRKVHRSAAQRCILDRHPSQHWTKRRLADVVTYRNQACVRLPSLIQREWAENRLADFRLWTANIGAFARDRASLDMRLDTEQETKILVVKILTLLHGCVETCLTLGTCVCLSLHIYYRG